MEMLHKQPSSYPCYRSQWLHLPFPYLWQSQWLHEENINVLHVCKKKHFYTEQFRKLICGFERPSQTEDFEQV